MVIHGILWNVRILYKSEIKNMLCYVIPIVQVHITNTNMLCGDAHTAANMAAKYIMPASFLIEDHRFRSQSRKPSLLLESCQQKHVISM